MIKYPVRLNKEDGFWFVEFIDFPHINTFGESKVEALKNAHEALNGCIESDFNRNYNFVEPSNQNKADAYVNVDLNIEIAFKIRKIRDNLAATQIDMAHKLGISYQAYQKLENPSKCNPTIKTLNRVANVFGKHLEILFENNPSQKRVF